MATVEFQAMLCKSLLFEMKLVQHGAVAENMATLALHHHLGMPACLITGGEKKQNNKKKKQEAEQLILDFHLLSVLRRETCTLRVWLTA